jgi:enamine deaminase RidA (YjgF/YER057c/UK114 family)
MRPSRAGSGPNGPGVSGRAVSHLFINPPELPNAIGFSHVAIAHPGQTVFLAGQAGHRPDGTISTELLDQFGQACRNVALALESTGASRDDLVNLHIFVTDVAAYRRLRRELGEAYREVFGRHYPPMALFGVGELFDPAAWVELVGTAVIPTVPRSTSNPSGISENVGRN